MMYNSWFVNRINLFLYENKIRFKYESLVYDNIQDSCSTYLYLINGSKYYAKIFTCRNDESVDLEVKFVNYLSAHGIIVPSFLEINGKEIFDISNKETKCLLVFMSEVLGDSIIAPNTLNDIVKNVAKIHNISLGFDYENCVLKPVNDKYLLKEFIDMNPIFLKDIYDVEKLKGYLNGEPIKSRYYFIHADLHLANIVVRHGFFYGLIDFSDMRLGLFEDDLGKLFQNYLTSEMATMETIKEQIELYRKCRDEDVAVDEIFISCIYRVLYNLKFVKRTQGMSSYQTKKNKYVKVIDDCVRELEKL